MNRHRRGFTLLELMVVVVIVGLLATMVAVNVMDRLEKAKLVRAAADVSTIEGAATDFKIDYHRFPRDLDELLRPPDRAGLLKAPKPYLDPRKIRDPWDRVYILEGLDDELIVRSSGRDGIDGTEDDITNQMEATDATEGATGSVATR